MAERYEIDYVRAIIEFILNDTSMSLVSFYEQISDPTLLPRYAKRIKDVIDDANKDDYKARGVISVVGETDIVNIKSNYIAPLEYAVRFDLANLDRDYVNVKLIDLIDGVKGRKFDLIQGENGDIYVCACPTLIVGTVNHLEMKDYVYMYYDGLLDITDSDNWDTIVATLMGGSNLWVKPSSITTGTQDYIVYVNAPGETAGTRAIYEVNITYDSQGGGFYEITDVNLLESTFTQYKVSLSIKGLQRSDVVNLNAKDRTAILFGGQATIVDENVMLGNDLIGTSIKVGSSSHTYLVEPTEMPTASKTGDSDNAFYQTSVPKPITNNTNITTNPTFSFVVDKDNVILWEMYKLARYQTLGTEIAHLNYVFTITEYDYQFGVLTTSTMKSKIDDIGVLTTNGDVMMIKVSFKLGAYT